jgi:hypothetical protein
MLATAMAVLVVMAGTAWGGTPDPDLSNVPNVLYIPGGTMEYVVHVESTEGPIDSAVVQLVFSAEAAGLICWCSGQSQPLIESTTNANGDASFFIAAGGCINPDSLVAADPPVEVIVNGFSLAEVGCVSPDAVDNNATYPWQGWDTEGICSAQTSDAILHTPPFSLGTYSFCSDLNGDNAVGLDDAILATPSLSLGFSCSQAP